jgi:hypothetical protein
VSISQLVDDFDTEVTTIQGDHSLLARHGRADDRRGQVGDLAGRRSAVGIGHAVYAGGSLLTAVAWSVPGLTLGWSVLEGIGAALVLPAQSARG